MTDISYWLMKSEPDVYGINHLKNEHQTIWDGIRNYQARNFMRKMKVNDQAFFYHSNCKEPGIVGLMQVSQINIIDPTQFDINSKYYDPKSSKEKPRWDCAKLTYLGQFKNTFTLKSLKEIYSSEELLVVKKGNRLSILPVPETTAKNIIKRLGSLIR